MTGPFNSPLAAVRAGFRAIIADNNKQNYREFGFWVIMKHNGDKSGVDFFYSKIMDGGPNEVSMELPHGFVSANCHTHPAKRYHTENFSTHDKKSFMMLRDKKHEMPFYLLTPSGQISVMNELKDFPTGKPVPWS